ncbi:DnaJ C terminal region family protein [Trichomonas vaginalis G3]|uniref:DnaJ C terminal region family protein n=1 Tax=Trichomonas vaginalis (strain ATCC PRA-98 / G3) TaxID=412133 RepID=A2EI79_TRIV3|nr:protein folding [Trichomonas vaginalis G3]EAY07639.1 DnaJ C terminal region family protein [Trichomonas vaginalis G3]KAI5500513.1 protein folding [Trichomonas vaginalis G3]|eukprot:XP_001319862.1 DnaJ C terminal region family protein [Trichomonas vaginalis G3]
MIDQWNDIERAYSILKNEASRSIFDQIGNEAFEHDNFSIIAYRSDQEIMALNYFDSNKAFQVKDFGGIINFPLYLELQDFMTGKRKNFHIFQSVPCVCSQKAKTCKKCQSSPWVSQYQHYTLSIPKGTRPNSRIFAKNVTDSEKYRGATDVIFLLKPKPNKNFKLVEYDLYSNITVPLASAFTKQTYPFKNLDGQTIQLTLQDVKEGQQITIPGKGFPYQNSPKSRGNLILTVTYEFPHNLTEDQKSKIKNILSDDISDYK